MLATIVTVMLDAFSGVTNPTWSLTEKDAGALQESVNRIVATRPVEPPHIPDLGYRGLVIEGLDIRGKSTVVRIFRNWLIVGGNADVRAWQDKDNSLEMWLVDLGRGQVPANRIPDVFRKQ